MNHFDNERLRRPRKSRFAKFFFWLVFIFCLSALSVYFLVKDLPNPQRITERNLFQSTKIYDRTGKIVLYEIHGEEKRTVVSFAEIPDFVKEATLAAEDINFYNHVGLDWRGILRAVFRNIESGSLDQGGSTITQQLIKNSLLGPQKTLMRKAKELVLALLLERKYSKDEILGLYLNQIPYGSNAYGVSAAAQTYFGKEVKELNLAESTILAALPKAPTYYSPFGSHKEDLFNRKDWILDRMAEAKFITRGEAEVAKKVSLVFVPPKQSILAPHFVMFVREYLNNKYGDALVEQEGLKVITTLDWSMQELAEKIIKEGADSNYKNIGAANASLVAINPKTGEILTMVGSKNYFGESEPANCTPGVNCKFDPHVNITTRLRQPGSAFKPFVYATAFKKGYTPETILFDVFTEFNPDCNPDGTQKRAPNQSECYHPHNYDTKFRGPVSIRKSLAQSLNIPSVKLLYLAGIPESISTAQDLGITSLTSPEKYGLALVLGGAEVSLLEMTSAFGAFAQDGILHPKTAILKIENSKGEALEEFEDASLPVIETEVARTINNILSDNEARVPVFSPQSSLYFPNRQVAVKTGTTQESRDAWVLGYTPSLAVGVWAGNNDNTTMNKSAISVIVAGPIWHKFLDEALKSMPPETFALAEPRNPDKAVLRGIYRGGQVVKIDKITKKIATENTPPDLVEEVGTGEVKSILALLNKDDPLGSSPTQIDAQLKNWQFTIDKWLGKNKLVSPVLPQGTDDVHSPDKKPKIILTFPQMNSSAVSRISANIKSSFPLKDISFFINDELVGSKNSFDGENIDLGLGRKLLAGEYMFKISAYDTVGNQTILESKISVAP